MSLASVFSSDSCVLALLRGEDVPLLVHPLDDCERDNLAERHDLELVRAVPVQTASGSA